MSQLLIFAVNDFLLLKCVYLIAITSQEKHYIFLKYYFFYLFKNYWKRGLFCTKEVQKCRGWDRDEKECDGGCKMCEVRKIVNSTHINLIGFFEKLRENCAKVLVFLDGVCACVSFHANLFE